MPRFLFEASYTLEGLKGLRRQGGSGRREAVARAAQSVGGRLEHFYFAFGEHDAFAVADLSGYTQLTEESGDEVAAEISLTLAQLVNEIAARHQGSVVTRVGSI